MLTLDYTTQLGKKILFFWDVWFTGRGKCFAIPYPCPLNIKPKTPSLWNKSIDLEMCQMVEFCQLPDHIGGPGSG
jgi:hypothetical protein